MTTTIYQPQTVSEIVFGNDESRLLIEDIVSGELPFPFEGKTGILLYGTWGTGKTTLASILPEIIEQGQTGQQLSFPADYFGCQQGSTGIAFTAAVSKRLSVLSLNASGNDYFIFDEVDNLNKVAQAGLKTILNSKRAIFILTTNNISQLDKGVKDRCVLVEMNAATDPEFLPLARRIASDKNVVLNDAELMSAIEGSNGSFRNIIFNVLVMAIRKARKNKAALELTSSVIQQATKPSFQQPSNLGE
jgi:replication-associated recombination protein RarA